MSKLRAVRFREMERVLLRLGFTGVCQKGSYVFYRHADGRTTTVPNYQGRDLARPLIREILREVDITPAQFQEELERS